MRTTKRTKVKTGKSGHKAVGGEEEDQPTNMMNGQGGSGNAQTTNGRRRGTWTARDA